MTIVVYKRLTRNPEIGNTSVCFLPNICRLGRVRDTKFATNVSNEMLQNVAKCKCYSFPRFRVIQANPTEGGGGVRLKWTKTTYYVRLGYDTGQHI